MKKILVVLIGLIIIAPTYATTMCAANNTVAVVLDPSLPIKDSGNNATTGTWWTWSDAWTVYGIFSCLNSNHDQRIGGTVQILYDTNSNGIEKKVVGFEKNGRYCWCRLRHPVVSGWWLAESHSSSAFCESRCMSMCITSFYNDTGNTRKNVFNSISN